MITIVAGFCGWASGAEAEPSARAADGHAGESPGAPAEAPPATGFGQPQTSRDGPLRAEGTPRMEPSAHLEHGERRAPGAEVQERLPLTPDFTRETPRAVPTELETPSFAAKEAGARAQARSQVVEVTGADGDKLADVPRLEEVLAEAGADLIDPLPGPVSPAPQSEEEIAPPRIPHRPDEDARRLYFDPEKPDA